MTALVLDRISRTFGAGPTAVHALADVSMSVEPGEFVLVMGPSGSGKTTLLSVCGALMRPSSGRVEIDGIDITGLAERELPETRLRKIGFVFQAFSLLANLTALENVRIVQEAAGVAKGAADQRARALLSELRLEHRLHARPESLSGGEKQRVAIARALANDAPVLLADEPTANLDSRSGYQVMHMLQLLARERAKTVVVVTHDDRIVDVADRVLWLEDGILGDHVEDTESRVIDPVCGMRIDPSRAAVVRHGRGSVVHLCSEICSERFERDPDAYRPPS